MDHVFLLVPAQDYVGKFLMTFKDYPQRQKAASFNLDEVMQKLKEGREQVSRVEVQFAPACASGAGRLIPWCPAELHRCVP